MGGKNTVDGAEIPVAQREEVVQNRGRGGRQTGLYGHGERQQPPGRGGAQLMVTVVGRDDLENAMKRPWDYTGLLVRVGGFSARFVELSPEVQKDILSRTCY